MVLDGRTVSIYLTPEGFEQVNFLLGLEGKDTGAVGLVVNTDGFGIWISSADDRWRRTRIVPWRYLRAMEVEFETEPGREVKRKIGFRAG